MNLEDLIPLIASHKWVIVAAMVITMLLRLGKLDPKVRLHKRWIPWASLVFGAISGVVARYGLNETWVAAFVGGLFAGCFPVVGHEVLIESIRNGKEIAVARQKD